MTDVPLKPDLDGLSLFPTPRKGSYEVRLKGRKVGMLTLGATPLREHIADLFDEAACLLGACEDAAAALDAAEYSAAVSEAGSSVRVAAKRARRTYQNLPAVKRADLEARRARWSTPSKFPKHEAFRKERLARIEAELAALDAADKVRAA